MLRYALILVFILPQFNGFAQVVGKRTVMLMGGRFDITIVAKDSQAAALYIDTVIMEITRIENLISDWKPASQVSAINRLAGIRPVHVDRELFALIQRAIHLSIITGGAFDISFAAMDRIWKFDGSMTEMPSAEAIKKSVERVGYRDIVLDSVQSTVFLRREGMKIGFGALGEGYAADRCRELMITRGIAAGIVNGSGDMSTWGRQPGGRPWTIGITNPFRPQELLTTLPLRQWSVVTSGSYEKFVELNGKRYAHIINPATGYPSTGLTSVTVLGPSAELANGLSTAVMVLGSSAGIGLLGRYPEYQYLILTDDRQIFYSQKLFGRRKVKRLNNNLSAPARATERN